MERHLQEGGFVAVSWLHFTPPRMPGWSLCDSLGPFLLAGILSMVLQSHLSAH